MIILTSTTDQITVKLSANITSNQLGCYACFRDTTDSTIVPGRKVILTNNTSAVTMVESPPSSTQRIIDYLSVYNNDSSTATVTISLDKNGTNYEFLSVDLGPNEKIEYVEGRGFQCFDLSGSLKKTMTGEYNNITSWSSTILSNDVVNNNATLNTISDITGLSFPVIADKVYWFQFWVAYTSAASTTGCRFSLNYVGATPALYYYSKYSLSTTTQTTNQGLSTFDSPAASNAGSPATLVGLALVEGIISMVGGGTVSARFASEVANSAITAKAGSVVYYRQLN